MQLVLEGRDGFEGFLGTLYLFLGTIARATCWLRLAAMS